MTEIRRQAQLRRREIGLELGYPAAAGAVVEACLSALGLEQEFAQPGDPMLAGAIAVLDVKLKLITQDETRTLPQQSVDAAHEIAHL